MLLLPNIDMTTTKLNNQEKFLKPFASSKSNMEASQASAQTPLVGESIQSLCLPKNKKPSSKVLTSSAGNARSGLLSNGYREKKRLKDNKKTSRSRGRRRGWQGQKKLRSKQQQENLRRRLWTTEEDKAISSLVEHHGIRKWTLISRKLQDKYHIYGRSGKQCRERLVYSYNQ